MQIQYRQAKISDISSLSQMRWDFQIVGRENFLDIKEEFKKSCEEFLENSFKSGNWLHFIAEYQEEIIAHVSLQIVTNIPIPNNLENSWAYLTNAYTKLEFRKKGIGTQLIQNALEWADNNDIHKIILWPRDASIKIYKRFGFIKNSDIMERHIE